MILFFSGYLVKNLSDGNLVPVQDSTGGRGRPKGQARFNLIQRAIE